jgi:ADP-dependent NAD(P)H-hydrate dehydratase
MIPPIEDLLAAHPLPPADGDKDQRGVAVIVAGSEECPGAARLAATAALRAGAGKVQVVTHPTLTAALGVAVPEALVVAWDPETPPNERVKEVSARADAVLVGPGLMPGATAIARAIADHVEVGTPLLLDARSLGAATDLPGHRLVLLPNLGEAEELVGGADPEGEVADLASRLAARFEAVVAVRDATTVVGEGERQWVSGAHEGLGTGGSGDVLSGVAADRRPPRGGIARGAGLRLPRT